MSVAFLLGYGLFAQWLHHRDSLKLPRVLPTYHFHLYLKAAESLLFGVGFAALVGTLAVILPGMPAPGRRRISAPTATLGLLLVLVAILLPSYVNGVEFTKFREDSERIGSERDRIALYDWLRASAKSSDVFLTDMNTALFAVSAANRKVVCMGDQYSNIYVNYQEREKNLGRLYAALRAGDRTEFANLADKYHITHVILAKSASPAYRAAPENMNDDRFTLIYSRDEYRVYGLK